MTVRLQRLTWPTSAPFRVRARCPVSGQLSGTAAGGRGHLNPGFLPPFGTPAFASWAILFPPGSSASLTVGLPATITRPDPDGVPTFRWHEARPGRAPSMPRRRRCPRGWPNAPSRRLPLLSGQPLHPGNATHRPGLTLTRRHQGFTHVHPSGLPLACDSRMEQEPLGFNPELRTPQLPAAHVRAGTDLEHSSGATSPLPASYNKPTRNQRPRVAPP